MVNEPESDVILLTGGTGFVGTRVAHALRRRGMTVRALVRDRRRASSLETWGCELVVGDVTDTESVRAATNGVSRVIHLVSIIHGSSAEFETVMVDGTRFLMNAASENGCDRFVLMSALGTTQQSSRIVPYYRSKLEMERLVVESDVAEVVLRPGFIFGRGGALVTFARQIRLSPVTPVAGSGERKLQPIWVDDVASFAARSVDGADPPTGTFELGGPDVISWNELYAAIAAVLGKRRAQVHVPIGLLRLAATVLERLPNPPVTRDQLTMLKLADNVCDPTEANTAFDVTPIGLTEMLERSLLNTTTA
jgi:NADH dehydrogenase